MGITRRSLLQYLASYWTLSAVSCPALAETRLLQAFGHLPVSQNIHRVVSAGAPADLLLLALIPEKLLGLSSFDLSAIPHPFLSHKLRQLPKLGRLSGRASTLSMETLLMLNPDIIIDCGNVDATFRSLAQRTAKKTGIPYLLVDGKLQDSAVQLRQLGALLGVNDRAEQQAKMAERFLAEATLFATAQTASVTFYSARGPRGLETGLKGSLHTEVAELLGLRNVAQSGKRSGLAQISMEQLLLWQPDLIITQDLATYRYIVQDPVWQGVSAVAQRNILLFDGMPFGWLDAPPGINRLLGLRRLQAYLDPSIASLFPQEMRLFFKLFYHSDLTDQQYQDLMEAQ